MEEEINPVEIGYCIGEEYWNRVITSEAFNEVPVSEVNTISG